MYLRLFGLIPNTNQGLDNSNFKLLSKAMLKEKKKVKCPDLFKMDYKRLGKKNKSQHVFIKNHRKMNK